MTARKAAVAILALVICAVIAPGASADDEASNSPYVATDDYGRCFAHTIPEERYGTAGRTDVYAVGAGYPPGDDLTLLHSYDWYAPQLYVACNVSNGVGVLAPALVQVGPWPRGHKPNDETLAIAFHYNGETLASYSTLDIAGDDPKNASCSVSHYTVVEGIEGFERNYGDGDRLFRLTTVDGRRLTFSATTGALLQTARGAPDEHRGECFAGYPE